jgi:hypothetical protein
MSLLEVPFVRDHRARAAAYLKANIAHVLDRELEIPFDADCRIESPLEAAFRVWWEAVSIALQPMARLRLCPQREVVVDGKVYRLDFVVAPWGETWGRIRDDAQRFGLPFPEFAIELDGHDFHERTKEQVALRDRRDRDLQNAGWRVLHFSGAEFHRNPRAAVSDTYLTVFDAYRGLWCEVAERKGAAAGF